MNTERQHPEAESADTESHASVERRLRRIPRGMIRCRRDPSETAIETKVRLVITGFPMDPAELQRVLGLQGTDSWRRGEPRGMMPGVYDHNYWEMKSDQPLSAGLGQHLAALLPAIAPARRRLREIRSYSDVSILCVIYFDSDDPPSIRLCPDTIRRLADLQIPVYVDLYNFLQ